MKLSPWEPDLQTIVQRIDGGDIDLQPDFQRQEIWSQVKKKRLIDSILRGWSIPPIFLVVESDGRMVVLDGQQRLAAIRDFVHNDFTIDGSVTPLDEKIKSLDGATYKKLTAVDKRLFDQYTLRCFRITDYLPEEPSELFYRLNQPSILTAGEQRNAFFGPAREQLKELVSLFEADGNEKKTIGFSNARLAYDDIIARLLVFLEAGTFAKKGTESLISQRFRSRERFSEFVFDRAFDCIRLFGDTRRKINSTKLNKASVLSWLLFYSRFTMVDPASDFMQLLLASEGRFPPGTFVREAIAVFQNRASLRVTDVSSVVYRDFCLWYSYYFTGHTSLPSSVFLKSMERVHDDLNSRDDVTFEFVLGQTLDIEQWGAFR